MFKIWPATEIVVKSHHGAVTIVGRMTDIVTGSRSCSVTEALVTTIMRCKLLSMQVSGGAGKAIQLSPP